MVCVIQTETLPELDRFRIVFEDGNRSVIESTAER